MRVMVRNSSIKSMLEDCDQDTYDRMIHEAKLTPEEQAICRLKYCEGMQLYQIAMELKCSDSKVYKMHTRILDKLSWMINM